MNDADCLNVKCFECGWTGNARPGDLVICPRCGEFAAEVAETVVRGPFLFRLLPLWHRPHAMIAAMIWNACERYHIRQPWSTGWLFGVIMGEEGGPRHKHK